MKKRTLLSLALIVVVSLASVAVLTAKDTTFKGKISDAMCGLKHSMAGASDKDCTLQCVKGGSKFVLADVANKKVYELDDQTKPREFAGASVVITGSLQKDGKTIHVSSIAAAQ